MYLGQIYLPERRYCTMPFLKAILSGKKKHFLNKDVRRISVPRYKQLSLKKILEHVNTVDSTISCYLPDDIDIEDPQIDREFLFSVVNTVDSGFFPR